MIKLALRSKQLKACNEICNGTKHLGARPGARHQHIELMVDSAGDTEMDCIFDSAEEVSGELFGGTISGRMLAHQCIAEWISILQSQGLATARLS